MSERKSLLTLTCALWEIEDKKATQLENHHTSDMSWYGQDAASRELSGYVQQKHQRRRDFYTSCRDGRQEYRQRQQQQQPPATKKFQAEKTRDLLRCVYPANPSGSKVISLGLDPSLDFEPVVNLYKAGFPGVKFEAHAFDELCNNADFVRNYFQGAAVESGQMQISNNIIMKFTSCFGKPAIEFIKHMESENERSVVITADTWLYIYDMIPLLRRVFLTLTNASASVNLLFKNILDHTTNNYRLAPNTPTAILQDVKNFLHSMDAEEITKNMAEGLDKPRIFYEIIHFCLYDFATAIRLSK